MAPGLFAGNVPQRQWKRRKALHGGKGGVNDVRDPRVGSQPVAQSRASGQCASDRQPIHYVVGAQHGDRQIGLNFALGLCCLQQLQRMLGIRA